MAMERLDKLIAGAILALATMAGGAICCVAIWEGIGLTYVSSRPGYAILAAIVVAIVGGPLVLGWLRFVRGGLLTAMLCGLGVLALSVLLVRFVEGFLSFN